MPENLFGEKFKEPTEKEPETKSKGQVIKDYLKATKEEFYRRMGWEIK